MYTWIFNNHGDVDCVVCVPCVLYIENRMYASFSHPQQAENWAKLLQSDNYSIKLQTTTDALIEADNALQTLQGELS
jgi:hypothetical protein